MNATIKEFVTYRNLVWLVIAMTASLVMSLAISEDSWVHLGLTAAPFLLYLAFKRPFFFPFGLYVFLLPFENVLVVTGSSQGPTVTRYLGVFAILVLSLKGAIENKMKRPDTVVLWWTLFIIYGFLSTLWAIQPSLAAGRIQTALGLLLLYLVAASFQVRQKEYDTIKWMALAGGFIAGLAMIYQYLTSHGDAMRMSITVGDAEAGLNKQGFDLLIPVSIGTAMMLKERNNIMKGSFLLMVIVCVFGIILTGSRGNLLAVLTMAAVYILFVKDVKRKILYGTLFLLSAAVIVPIVPEFMVERIRDSVGSHASGRGDIWIVGLKSLEKYWLFGAGLDNFIKAYSEFVMYSPAFMGLDRAPHNIFVGFAAELGIIGFSLMLMGIVKHYQATRSRPASVANDDIMLQAAFWGIMIASLSNDIVWYKSFWLLWILIVVHKFVIRSNSRPSPETFYSDPVQNVR